MLFCVSDKRKKWVAVVVVVLMRVKLVRVKSCKVHALARCVSVCCRKAFRNKFRKATQVAEVGT